MTLFAPCETECRQVRNCTIEVHANLQRYDSRSDASSMLLKEVRSVGTDGLSRLAAFAVADGARDRRVRPHSLAQADGG